VRGGAGRAHSVIPFGTGARICGGVDLAHNIMRIVLVPVRRNFKVEVAPGRTRKHMDMDGEAESAEEGFRGGRARLTRACAVGC
jgi:hypothetical protein